MRYLRLRWSLPPGCQCGRGGGRVEGLWPYAMQQRHFWKRGLQVSGGHRGARICLFLPTPHTSHPAAPELIPGKKQQKCPFHISEATCFINNWNFILMWASQKQKHCFLSVLHRDHWSFSVGSHPGPRTSTKAQKKEGWVSCRAYSLTLPESSGGEGQGEENGEKAPSK